MRAHSRRGDICADRSDVRTDYANDSRHEVGRGDRTEPVPLNDLDDRPVGRLDEIKRSEFDRALRFALDIVY